MNQLNESKESVTKFDIDGKPFYIRVIWKLNETEMFDLKVYDSDGNSWSGCFYNELATKPRRLFDETEAQYCENVRKGLRGNSDFSYSFTLSNSSESAIFSWKKRFEDGSKAVHGSVHLRRDSTAESKDHLLDLLLAENSQLKDTIVSITQKNEQVNIDLEKYKEELKNLVDIKTSLESSLYGKFLQLLNAKKKRIQLLEETIQSYSKTDTS